MEKIDKKFKLIFIDLDGTLIRTQSGNKFPVCIADMTPIWETWNALRDWANGREDFKVHIVSNQSGIPRGLVNGTLWQKKAEFICQALWEYLGQGKYEVTYDYCPSTKKDNYFRKPNPGMLDKYYRSVKDILGISKNDIVMIGDSAGKDGDFSDSDLMAAKNFGCSFIYVKDLWN